MSRKPAQLTGSTCAANSEMISEIAPTVPGKIMPGFHSSTTIPIRPIDTITKITLGSISRSRICCQRLSSASVTSAFAVSSTRPFGLVVRPSASFNSVGRSGAIRSITFWSRASSAVQLSPERTARSPTSGLRPWSRASPRSWADSFSIAFSRRSSGRSSPPLPTGVEEPIVVWGAIARRSPAWAMNAPAEVAEAPSGDT